MALCSVCQKNEASEKCAICGAPLCFECVKEVFVQETGPWCMSLGASISQIWAGEKYVKVCPKCFEGGEVL